MIARGAGFGRSLPAPLLLLLAWSTAGCHLNVIQIEQDADDAEAVGEDAVVDVPADGDDAEATVDVPGESADGDGEGDAGDVPAETDVPADDAGDVASPTCGDGVIDPGEECDGDPPRPCLTPCGSTGSRGCTDRCRWADECVPPAEICNGRDDDCDGLCDGGFACCLGAVVSCTTICGSTGAGICAAGCTEPSPPACTPPAEICNGRDDDCDTIPDGGFACVARARRACSVGLCAGTQDCNTGSCSWGDCDLGPPPPNDICMPGIPNISAGGLFTGSNCAATGTHDGTCNGTSAGGPDVFFRFVLSTNTDVTLDATGGDIEALLFLYSGALCAPVGPMACDDADDGVTRLSHRLSPGAYWVVLDSSPSSPRGNWTLAVTILAGTPPGGTAPDGAAYPD